MRLTSVIGMRFKRNYLSMAGVIVVLALVVVSLGAPVFAPYNPTAIDVDNILSPPSVAHPFGTDDLGRDVLSRMM